MRAPTRAFRRPPPQSPHALLSAMASQLRDVARLLEVIAEDHPTRAAPYRAAAESARAAARLLDP